MAGTDSGVGSSGVPNIAAWLAGVAGRLVDLFAPAYAANNATLNVKDFGAVGDGVTDDTARFVAALAAAHAGPIKRVFVPGGTYLVGDVEFPGDGITLEGEISGGYATPVSSATLLAKPGTTNVLKVLSTGTAVDRAYCRIRDLEIDGQGNAANGINLGGGPHNSVVGVTVERCTNAGILLSNWQNTTILDRLSLIGNTGWGIKVVGPNSTFISIWRSVLRVNTLGGINFEGGSMVSVRDTIIESNFGPGVRIYRPDTGIGGFCDGFTFDNVWLENNGRDAPFWSVVIDAQTPGAGNVTLVKWVNSNIYSGAAAQKYLSCLAANDTTFDNVNFGNSTAADAVTLGANVNRAAFLNTFGITAAQMLAALAQGTRCYASGPNDLRTPAALLNAWVNFGGGYAEAKFWQTSDGEVCLSGMLKDGVIGSSIFTLPVGFRPASSKRFAIHSNNAYGQVEIQADGDVIPDGGSNVSFSLDGVRFRTDA